MLYVHCHCRLPFLEEFQHEISHCINLWASSLVGIFSHVWTSHHHQQQQQWPFSMEFWHRKSHCMNLSDPLSCFIVFVIVFIIIFIISSSLASSAASRKPMKVANSASQWDSGYEWLTNCESVSRQSTWSSDPWGISSLIHWPQNIQESRRCIEATTETPVKMYLLKPLKWYGPSSRNYILKIFDPVAQAAHLYQGRVIGIFVVFYSNV